MRNLKRALSLALASVMLLGMMVVGTSADYADVTSAHNEEAIAVAQAAGIMIGDDAGNFNPDQKVTRNEMAVVMANMLGLKAEDYAGIELAFTDVPAWAAPYVAACYTNGIVAGTSATTYGGNDPVTTAQACLMAMKALGYFQNPGDFGDDWQLATVKQASKIELADGVNGGATTALTRNDVAQLVLNALECDVVEFSGVYGTDITTSDGTSITIGYVSEYDEYHNGDYNYQTGVANDGVQQLAEKLFKAKLTKVAATDDFQRPAHEWKWQTKSLGKFADEADVTYTAKTTAKKLYSDLGLSANYAGANVYVDGVPASDIDVIKNDETDANKFGAAGATTEVYKLVNPATGVITSIEIVTIETTYDKISSVGKDAEGNRIIRFGGKTFKTESFAKDDEIIYTQAYVDGAWKVMSVVAAEFQTGKVTKLVGTTDIYIDGTKYVKNCNFSDKGDWDLGDEVSFALNANGNIIRIAAVESTVNLDNLAFVELADEARGNYAVLRLADGTKKVVDTDKDYGASGENYANKVVMFKETDDGFKLTDKTAIAGYQSDIGAFADDAVVMGAASINNKTTFVYAIDMGTKTEYKVYTGYQAAPAFDNADIVSYDKDGAAVLVYVFVDNADINETMDKATLIVYDADIKLTRIKDVVAYYEYAAVVDGEITTVKVDETAWATVSSNGYGVITDNISVDTDGVAEVIANAADGNDTKVKVSGGVITFGVSNAKAIADDCVAVSVTDKQAVSVIDVTDILKDDDTTDTNPYAKVEYHLDDDGKVDFVVVYEA